MTETESARAQREERASPRKPKVVTDWRSEKEASLEVWCLSAATSQHEGGEGEGRRLTDVIVVLRGNTTAVIHDLKRLEPVVLEAHLSISRQAPLVSIRARDIPMLVAPASKLFSTSSFTAVWRSTTTWPEVIL